ncbi:Carboxypeptidase regulatory-like domain-containing protein [Agromyces sp. CF514]|nr:Carboxypeptidase regulatory-like domain-containing protein [Agromyces sp. CF514]
MLAFSTVQPASAEVSPYASITGTVRGPSGEPLPGATVELVEELPAELGGSSSRFAMTDATGVYTLSTVDPGIYTLKFSQYAAVASEWWGGRSDLTTAEKFEVSAGQALTGMDFQLRPAATVSGTISGEGTEDVSKFDVYLYELMDDGSHRYRGRSLVARNGTYSFGQLLGGRYTIRAIVPDSSLYVAAWWGGVGHEPDAHHFTVATGEAVRGIDLRLPIGAKISGSVKDELGKPFSYQSVRAYELTPAGYRVKAYAWSSSSGAYEFIGLPSGTYKVSFTPESDRYFGEWWQDAPDEAAARPIDVAQGQAVRNIDLDPALRSTISGVVRAPDGTGVAGARVEVFSTADLSNALKVLRSDANGAYSFAPLDPGTYTIRIEPPFPFISQWWSGQRSSATARTIPLGERDHVNADVELELGGTLSGIVSNRNGAPLEDVRVFAFDAGNNSQTIVGEGRTSSDGTYTVRGLDPGRYVLRFLPPETMGARAEWWDGATDRASAKPVEVSIGGVVSGLDAKLATGAALKGTVTGVDGKPLLNTLVTAYRLGTDGWYRQYRYAYADARGDYSLVGLLAGSYVLEFVPPPLSGYTKEFWNDQTLSGDSDPIELLEDQSVSGLNAVLTRGVALSAPTVSGRANVGSTLTVTASSTDAAVAFAYRWLADGAPLAGETEPTLELTDEHLGKRLSAEVTASKPGYEMTTRTTDETTPVALIEPAQLSAPSISGIAAVGKTMTAHAASSTPGAAFAYAWLADGVPIDGATQAAFTLGAAQLGTRVSVRVSVTASGYGPGTSESAATAMVAPGTPTVGTPTISGTAATGSILTAKPGGWTSGTSFTYQWDADGTAIAGATAATISLTDEVAGKAITVRVTGTAAGYETITKTSAATSKVFLAPVPTIAGTASVGSTLTADPGTWTAGATLAYQWYASGTAIPGATAATLKLRRTQTGRQVTVRVTGALSGYPTTARSSAPGLKATTAGTPTITGTAATGSLLTAKPGGWTHGTSFTYQWYADGTAIAGATAATIMLTDGLAGKAITVRVTGTAAGYVTVSKTSTATPKVSRAAPAAPNTGTPIGDPRPATTSTPPATLVPPEAPIASDRAATGSLPTAEPDARPWGTTSGERPPVAPPPVSTPDTADPAEMSTGDEATAEE